MSRDQVEITRFIQFDFSPEKLPVHERMCFLPRREMIVPRIFNFLPDFAEEPDEEVRSILIKELELY